MTCFPLAPIALAAPRPLQLLDDRRKTAGCDSHGYDDDDPKHDVGPVAGAGDQLHEPHDDRRARDSPPEVPEAAQDDHEEHLERDQGSKQRRVDDLLVRGEYPPRHTAQQRAEREGLDLPQRDVHAERLGGQRVVPHRLQLPAGAPAHEQPAQPERQQDDDPDEDVAGERRDEIGAERRDPRGSRTARSRRPEACR